MNIRPENQTEKRYSIMPYISLGTGLIMFCWSAHLAMTHRVDFDIVFTSLISLHLMRTGLYGIHVRRAHKSLYLALNNGVAPDEVYAAANKINKTGITGLVLNSLNLTKWRFQDFFKAEIYQHK